jgi:hypothetical protein
MISNYQKNLVQNGEQVKLDKKKREDKVGQIIRMPITKHNSRNK